ncbi:MAG: hypothetical protein N3F05_00440 [Candidatus Diapherotrites archaeon]|nr:hypothetical protein [Candidatus Diapherotrites archaeon]
MLESDFMSSNKEKKFKDFIISKRRSIRPGIGSTPVWIFQKANKRIFSSKQKRSWKTCEFGKEYRKLKKEA